MNWMIVVDSVLFVVCYLVWTCGLAYRIASYKSAWEIRVPDPVRVALLIFYFKREEISVMAIIFQIYTYIMLGFYLVSRLDCVQFFLIENIPDIDVIYTWALAIQSFGIFPVALAEEGIYYLKTRR